MDSRRIDPNEAGKMLIQEIIKLHEKLNRGYKLYPSSFKGKSLIELSTIRDRYEAQLRK